MTVIQLCLGTAAVGVAALVAIGLTSGCQENLEPPEQAAGRFVQDLHVKLVGKPNCAGVDTDGDGYVTCTLNVDDGDGRSHFESLQCAGYRAGGMGYGKYATGCKGTVAKAAPVPVNVNAPVITRQ